MNSLKFNILIGFGIITSIIIGKKIIDWMPIKEINSKKKHNIKTSPGASVYTIDLSSSRTINKLYTAEMQQDIVNIHRQDIEQSMMEALQYELQQKEIECSAKKNQIKNPWKK